MHKFMIALLISVVPVTAAGAQNMPVSQFLAKADALKKKGPLALLSSDIGVLKAEVQNSGKALRAEGLAAQKAGRKPAVCIPAKAELNSKEILDHMRSIPPAQRNMTVKAALADLSRAKFPCPK